MLTYSRCVGLNQITKIQSEGTRMRLSYYKTTDEQLAKYSPTLVEYLLTDTRERVWLKLAVYNISPITQVVCSCRGYNQDKFTDVNEQAYWFLSSLYVSLTTCVNHFNLCFRFNVATADNFTTNGRALANG